MLIKLLIILTFILSCGKVPKNSMRDREIRAFMEKDSDLDGKTNQQEKDLKTDPFINTSYIKNNFSFKKLKLNTSFYSSYTREGAVSLDFLDTQKSIEYAIDKLRLKADFSYYSKLLTSNIAGCIMKENFKALQKKYPEGRGLNSFISMSIANLKESDQSRFFIYNSGKRTKTYLVKKRDGLRTIALKFDPFELDTDLCLVYDNGIAQEELIGKKLKKTILLSHNTYKLIIWDARAHLESTILKRLKVKGSFLSDSDGQVKVFYKDDKMHLSEVEVNSDSSFFIDANVGDKIYISNTLESQKKSGRRLIKKMTGYRYTGSVSGFPVSKAYAHTCGRFEFARKQENMNFYFRPIVSKIYIADKSFLAHSQNNLQQFFKFEVVKEMLNAEGKIRVNLPKESLNLHSYKVNVDVKALAKFPGTICSHHKVPASCDSKQKLKLKHNLKVLKLSQF